jgi:hypothetical protein
VLVILFVSGCGGKVYSSKELDSLIGGKTRKVVVAILGKPDTCTLFQVFIHNGNESGGGMQLLYYDKVRDPDTGELQNISIPLERLDNEIVQRGAIDVWGW